MRLSERAQDNLVALLLLVTLVVFAGLSLTYGARARMVPLAVAVTTIFLLLVQFYLQNFRIDTVASISGAALFAKKLHEAEPHRDEHYLPTADESDEQVTAEEPGGTPLVGVLLVAAFVALFFAIGVLPAVFVYVLVYFVVITKMHVIRALAYATGMLLVIHTVFVTVLGVRMDGGYLSALLG